MFEIKIKFQSDKQFWENNFGILIRMYTALVKTLGNFYAKYKMRQIRGSAKTKETNCTCQAREEKINVERATEGEKRG